MDIVVVEIEGQTLELPVEIAGEDKSLRAALEPFFEGASQAKIVRTVKDGKPHAQVIKRAGRKATYQVDDLEHYHKSTTVERDTLQEAIDYALAEGCEASPIGIWRKDSGYLEVIVYEGRGFRGG